MTASGNSNTVCKKCKLMKTKIDKDTRTSNGGRFYDHCKVRNGKCSKDCVLYLGR